MTPKGAVIERTITPAGADGDRPVRPATRRRSPPPGGGPTRRTRVPLRGYLAALMVLFVAVIGSGAVYGRQQAVHDARQAAAQDANAGARVAATEIADGLDRLNLTTARTAAAAKVVAALRNPEGCTLAFLADGPFLSGRIDVVRADGSIVCSSQPPAAIGPGYGGAAWLSGALVSPLLISSGLDPATGAHGVISTAPVEGGGAVVGFLNLTALGPDLARDLSTGSRPLEFLLTDVNGETVLTRSIDPARWSGAPTAGTPFGGSAIALKRTGVDGRSRWYGTGIVKLTGWHVYAGADQAQALAPAGRLFHHQIVILLAGMALLLAAMAALDHRVTAPVRRLSEAMGRKSSGRTTGPVDTGGPSEVAALTQEVNDLYAVVDHDRLADSRLAAIVESSADAIIGQTLDGVITSWNGGAERLYGYPASDMVGSSVFRLAPADRPDELAAILAGVRRGDPAQHLETERIRKDGSRVDVSVVISVIRDGEGTVVGASSVARDVSERRRAEQAMRTMTADLARSNRELEQFAYVASHDLSEPLRTISGYVELLARRYGGQLDGDADRFIQHTVNGCTRMRTLIDDLLTYSRSGRSGELTGAVDCADLVGDVLGGLEGSLMATGGVVEMGDLPVVTGDRAQLALLFQNLIANSLKFARPEVRPKVRIDARAQDGRWVFSVSDNGIGIDPEYRDRIFGMFQRLHARDAYEGTGIGLAICLRTVQAHGGTIWVDDRAGPGTCICFDLAPDATVTP